MIVVRINMYALPHDDCGVCVFVCVREREREREGRKERKWGQPTQERKRERKKERKRLGVDTSLDYKHTDTNLD